MTLLPLVLAVASGLADGELPVARAEPSPPANVLALNVGFASAVGFVGGTYLRSLPGPLELEVGVGYGHSGIQGSLMAKLAFGEDTDKFVAGIGAALTLQHSEWARDNPVWLNVDLVGWEHRSRSGFFFGAAAGLFRGLGGGRACPSTCESAQNSPQDVRDLAGPQGRLSAGFAF